MDIKELNKTQLILLTLLITFVVSIATGIVTVTLMQQMPKSAAQTINNVIQRTIEKVTTVPAATTTTDTTKDSSASVVFGDGDAIVSIYPADSATASTPNTNPTDPKTTTEPKALGQGVIISDVGLVLVDSDILVDKDLYKVILNKTDFDATILKKFPNGFTILKISQKKAVTPPDPTKDTGTTPAVDKKP